MALAVFSLSPVSITTWIPMFCSSLMACGESSFITSATAITPISTPSFAKNNGVLPASDKASAWAFTAVGTVVLVLINFKLPPLRQLPCQTAVRPLPGSAWNSETSSKSMPTAFSKMAFASGCSLRFSNTAARWSSSSLETPSAGSRSVT